MRKLIWLASVLLAGAVLYGVAGEVQASRNSSGTYSLAAGNPVTTLQTIGSGLWNNTFNDLAADMTLSLDRNGRGGMLAALRGIDGTVAAPALSFTSETGSGLFRNGAGDIRFSLLGSSKTFWNATGFGVGAAPTFPFDVNKDPGSSANGVARFINGAASSLPLFAKSEASLAGLGFNTYFDGTNNKYAATGFADDVYLESSSGDLVFRTAPSGSAAGNATLTERMRVKATGLTIGASGTAISGSFRGSASLTPGSIAASSCATLTAITVTGAAAGSECVFMPASTSGLFSYYCVAALNQCVPVACNVTLGAATPPSGTYGCRVFNN